MAPRKKRKPSQAENIKILEQLIIDKDKMILDKDKIMIDKEKTIADLDKKLKKKDSLISDYKKLCVLTDYNLNRSVSAFDGAQRMVHFAQHVTYLKNTLEARCDSLNEKVNALESELAYKDRVIEKCELEIKQYTAMNDEFKITVEDLKNDQKKKKSDCHRLEEKVVEATKWAARLGKVIKEREIPLCKSDALLLGKIQKQLKQKGSVLKECDGDQLLESEILKHNATQTDESALNSMIYKNYRKVAAYTDGLGVLSPCLTADEGIGLSPGLSEISLATSCSNYKDNFQSYGPLHKEPTSVDDGSMTDLTTEIIEDSLDHSPATPAFSLFDVQVGNTKATISIGPQFTNDNIMNGSSENWPSIDTLNLSNCSVGSVKDAISTAHLNDDNDDMASKKQMTSENDNAKSKSDSIVTIEEDLDESAKRNGLVSSYIFLEGDKTYKMLKYRDHCKILLPHEEPQNSDGKNVEICDRLKKNVEASNSTNEEPKSLDRQIQNSDGKSVEICDRFKNNVEALSGTNGKLEECIMEKNLKKTLEEVVPVCEEFNKLDEVTDVFSTASPTIDKNWNVDPVSGEVSPIREKSDKLVEEPPVTEVFSSSSPSSPAKRNGSVNSCIFQEGDNTYKMLKYRDHCKIVLTHEEPQNSDGKNVEICDRLKNNVEASNSTLEECITEKKLKETLEDVLDEVPLVTEVFSTASQMVDKKLDMNPVSETVGEVVPICERSDKLDDAPLVTGVFSTESPMVDKKLDMNPVSETVGEVVPICERSDKLDDAPLVTGVFSTESPMVDKKLDMNPVSETVGEVVPIREESDKLDEVTEVFSTEPPMIDKNLNVNPMSGILEEVAPICESDKLDEVTEEFSPMIDDKVAVNHENDKVKDCDKRITVFEQVNLSNNSNDQLENDCTVSSIVEVNDSCLGEIDAVQNDLSIDNKCADLLPGDRENISEDNLITEMTTGADNKCADLQPGDRENISEHDSKTEMTVGADEILEEGNKTLDTLVSSYDEEQSLPSEHKVGEIVEEEIESMNLEAMQLENTKQTSGSSCASSDLIRDEDNAVSAIDLSIKVENVNNAQMNSETPKIEEEKPLTSTSSISIGENDGCKTNFTTESKSIGNNMSCMESNQDASMPLDLSLRQSNHALVKTPTPPRKSIFDNLENVTDLNNPPTNLNIHHKSLHFGNELQGTEQRSMICETKQFKTPLPLKQVKDPDDASKHKNSNRNISVVDDEVLDKIMRRMQMKSILKGPLVSPIPPSPQTSKQGPSIQMELSMLSSDGENSFAAPEHVGNSSYPKRKEETPINKSDESRNAHHNHETIITSPKCTAGTSLRNIGSKCNLKTISKRDHVGNSSYSLHKEEMPTTKSDESRTAQHTKQEREPGFNEIPSRIRSHREEESKSSTSERTANEASCIDAVRLEDVKPTPKYSCPNVSNVAEFDIDKLLAEIRRDFDVPDCIDELSDSVSISDTVELDCEEASDLENTLVSSKLLDELPQANIQSKIQFPDVIIAEEMQSPRCVMEEDICEEQTSVLSTTLIDQHANKSEVDKEGFSKATENVASVLADIPKATENAASSLADNPTGTSPGLSKICTNGNKILPDSAQSCNERAQSSDSTILLQAFEHHESLKNSEGSLAVPDKVSNSDESGFRGSLPNEPMISDSIDTGHEGEQNTNQSILANDFEQSTLNSSQENCKYSKMSDEVVGMDTVQCSDERALSSNTVNRLEACSLKSSETDIEYPPASKNLSESDGSDFKGCATLNSSEKPVGNSTVSQNLVDPGESAFENWTSSSNSLENASVPKLLSDSDESDFKGWVCTSNKRIENPPVSKNLSDSYESDFKGCDCTSNTSDKRIENPPVSKNLSDSDESDFKVFSPQVEKIEAVQLDYGRTTPPNQHCKKEKASRISSNSLQKTGIIQSPTRSSLRLEQMEKCNKFVCRTCGVDEKCNLSNCSKKRIFESPFAANETLSPAKATKTRKTSLTRQNEAPYMRSKSVPKDFSYMVTRSGKRILRAGSEEKSSPSNKREIPEDNLSLERIPNIDEVDTISSEVTNGYKNSLKSKNVNLRGRPIQRRSHPFYNTRRTSLQFNNDEVNTLREHKDESEPLIVENHRNLSNYSKKRISETSIAENEILAPAKVTKSRKAILPRKNEACSPIITRSKSVPKDFSYMLTRSGKRILRAGSADADRIEAKSSPSNKRDVSKDNLDEVDTISTEKRECEVANGYRNVLKSRNVNIRGRPIRRSSHPFYNNRRRFSQFDEVNTLREHNNESEPMIVENDRNLSDGRLHAKCETSSVINECESEHLSSCTGKTNESSNEICEKRSCLFVDCVNDSLQDSPLSPIDDEDLNDFAHFKKHSEELLSTDSINTMKTNCDISVNVNLDHSYFGGALQIDCQENSNDEIPHKNYCEVENEGEFSSSNCYENDISSTGCLKTYQRHIPVISIEHRKSIRRIPKTTSTITSQVPATGTESSLEIDPPLDETSTALEPSIDKVPTFNFYSEVSEATKQSSNKRKSDDSESLNLQPKIRKIEEHFSETISSHPVDADNPDAPKRVNTEKIKMVRCENVIVTAYDYHRKDLFKGYSKLDQSHPEEESEEDSEVAEYVFTRVARAVLENSVADETETCDETEPCDDSEECEPWTVEVVTECLEHLRGIPNNVIANLIVDTLYNDEGEVDLDGPAPLTDLQKKVLTISCKLCADTVNHPHFLQSLLSELKRFLLNYEESETVTRYCLYVRFLTILCRIHSEAEEMRSFIYDALYRKKMAGIPMVYTALIMWPPLLPFAQPLETACPLSLGITQVILNHKMNDYNNVYKIKRIEHILRKYYGYVRLEPIEVFKHLMRRINTEGALESVALLCKKIGPHWTVKFVIEDTLLPILNEYKANKNNSAAAVNAMRVSSYVLRPLLQGRYTGKLNLVLGTIGTLLTDPEADDMIEAVAAESLCRLSKGNMNLCAELLIKWKPRNGKVPLQLIELMKAFIARQKPVRWLELMTENNLIKRKGQKSQ